MAKFPEMPEFVVADVGPGGEVEVDGGHDEGGGGVAGGALQQPIRGCDCGHVTSFQRIPAHLAQLLAGGGVVVAQDHHHRHRHAHQHQQQPVRVPTTCNMSHKISLRRSLAMKCLEGVL